MAKRFYQPSSAQYLSQFVPDQLPADLMLKSLGTKQQQYDTQAAANEELAALNIRSLPGEDTRYAKGYKEKIQQFVDESYGQDLAAPDFQRKYRQFVKEYKNDSGLKSVAGAVATHDKYLDRIEELEKKGEFAAADEMRNNYTRRFNMYTADEGLGYKGDVSLGDPLVGEGVDRFKENLKFFEPLKESGSENIGFLDEGISYKNGWSGISDQRVRQQADRMFNDWISSPGGKQTIELYNMQNGIGDYEVSKLSPDKKEEYKENLDNFLKNEFLEVGRTVVHGKSTTNMENAYNTRNRRAYQEEKERAASPILTDQLQGVQVGDPNLSWEAQQGKLGKEASEIRNMLTDIKAGRARVSSDRVSQLEDRLKLIKSQYDLIDQEKKTKYNVEYQNSEKDIRKDPELLNKYFSYVAQYNLDKSRNPSKYQFEKQPSIEDYVKMQTTELTNDRWKYKYYSGRGSAQNIEYMGVTATPATKGGTAQVEEKMINTIRDGYTFYDETGKEISSDDLAFDFKIGGITQQNYKGESRGRVGTATRQTPIYDEDGKFLKYQKTPIKVIAVPRDPNYRVTNNSYARDYFEEAKKQEAQGYIDGAKTARREAITLMNPELANKFDQAENSQNFNSGPIEINVGASDGKNVSLQKVNVMLDKLDDGTYNVSLKNINGTNIVAPKNFNDIKAAQEFVLNVGL